MTNAPDPYKFPNGRLREAGAHRIHELCDQRVTFQKIAEELGIAIGTVYNIRHGKTWPGILEERERLAVAAVQNKG